MRPAAPASHGVLAAAYQGACRVPWPPQHTPLLRLDLPSPAGEVLQEVEETLQEFHAHIYGPDGSGGGAADMLRVGGQGARCSAPGW